MMALVAGSVLGQQSGTAQANDQGPVFKTSVDVVDIYCTVQKDGKYVTNLTRNDFEIFEDGVKQELLYFAFEQGKDARPLNVVLMVDTSGSVKDKLMFEQEAATAFLEETLRPEKDMAAVIQFDSEINLVQDFTYDLDLLSNAIGEIRAGGATKLYDAIYVAVDDLLRHEEGRRVMVILSDGDDTHSQLTDKEAVKVAQQNDVVIFGIGVQGGRFRSSFGTLKDFAKDTGGLFFNSKIGIDELRDAFSRINSAIKSQYSIGYVSTNPAHDGTFREILVKVNGKNLKVNHRKGYYSAKS